jgi:YVTN family beta-propeller protein
VKAEYFRRYLSDTALNEDWASGSLGAFNAVEHQELSLTFLPAALHTLPFIQANRRIFFLGGWLGSFLNGQTSEAALDIVRRYLADDPKLPRDLRQKVLQNADELERTVRIKKRFQQPQQACFRIAPAGMVVISNMNDNTATVIDAGTCRVLATLPTGEGPHEVAASHDGRWAIVSNYGVRGKPGNTLTVIDLTTIRVARTIDLGEYRRPHGMVFLPGDTLLAVTSEVSQAVLVVDLRTDRVVRTLPTHGRSSHMVTMPRSGSPLFTTNIADGTISRLDPAAPDAPVVIPAARQDEGLAVTPDGAAVWVGSNRDSIVVIINTATRVAADTLRGFGMPYRLAITPDGALAVITDPVRSEIRIFDARSHQLRHLVSVPRDSVLSTSEIAGSASPEGVTVSRDSRWAFVTLQGRNRVVTIDLERGTIMAYVPTGTWSDGIAYSPRSAPER